MIIAVLTGFVLLDKAIFESGNTVACFYWC